MSLALCASSHSPLIGVNDPQPATVAAVEAASTSARDFIRSYDPELVVIFAPDHYNGFFYDMMPPFCVGRAAESVGDYGLPKGALRVDREAASRVLDEVLRAGVDLAMSEHMKVDHGFVQPLVRLFGGVDAVPVVPVFINCVAEPLGPCSRVMALGEAIGRSLPMLGKRVLVVGSGGLSHDPPVPRLAEATPEVAQRLTFGRDPTSEQRAVREANTTAAAREFAAGRGPSQSLNPEWDRHVLDRLAEGDVAAVAGQPNDWFVTNGGHSAHEVRTWVAAYAALSTQGPYRVDLSFYEPIPEWFAGFGITTAVSA